MSKSQFKLYIRKDKGNGKPGPLVNVTKTIIAKAFIENIDNVNNAAKAKSLPFTVNMNEEEIYILRKYFGIQTLDIPVYVDMFSTSTPVLILNPLTTTI